MKKNKKVIIIICNVIFIILLCLGIWYFLIRDIEYSNPIVRLKQENITLSKSELRKIESNFLEALNERNLEKENLVYYENTYQLQNNQYTGRFAGDNTFMYQFKIDLDTKEVKIIEIAKRQLPLEYQEANEGNYIDGYQ